MVSKEKKPYGAPDIEKVPLSDEDLDKVSGGAQPDGGTDGSDLSLDGGEGQGEDGGSGNTNNENIGTGLPPMRRRNARTFGAGRNSGC